MNEFKHPIDNRRDKVVEEQEKQPFRFRLREIILFQLIVGVSVIIGNLDFLGGLVVFAVLFFLQSIFHLHPAAVEKILLAGCFSVVVASVSGGFISWILLSITKRAGEQLMIDPPASAIFATVISMFYCSVFVGVTGAVYLFWRKLTHSN